MLGYDNTHVGVYQVLDQVLSSTAVPPGAKGALFSIIDDLRASSCSPENVRRAERISVEIHNLELALRAADEHAQECVRGELKALAVAWLKTRISTPRSPLTNEPPAACSAGASRMAPTASLTNGWAAKS